MKKNFMLEKLRTGEQVIGTFMEYTDSLLVEGLGVGGFDFLIVDFEHSDYTAEMLMPMSQAAEYRKITPLTRVKGISRANILRPLDAGMQGLIIPEITTLDEVKQVVTWGKYAPLGERGFFTSRITDYGYSDSMKDLTTLFQRMNEETMIIPQIQTIESYELIEEIASIEGVDGIFIGPVGLSNALGVPTQLDHPKLQSAIQRIHQACLDNDIYSFIYADDIDMAKNFKNQGYNAIVCGIDTRIFIQAVKDLLKDLK